jgi:hypothetical protein
LHDPGRADVAETGGREDLPAVHVPDRKIAAVVLPKNVALAIAVVIAGLHDIPDARHHAKTRTRLKLCAVEPPDHHGAGIAVLPQNGNYSPRVG